MPIILAIVLIFFFSFLDSSPAHLEPELELTEVWNMMVRQITFNVFRLSKRQILMLKIGQNFHNCLRSGPEAPPLTVSLAVRSARTESKEKSPLESEG